MATQRNFILLNFLFTIFTYSISFHHSLEIPTATRLELIHRRRNDGGAATGKLHHLKQLVQNDAVRVASISDKVDRSRGGDGGIRRRRVEEDGGGGGGYSKACDNGGGRKNSNVTVELPMNSAADYGTGEYFVHVRVGSPPQRAMLVVDTGSDLTWVKCSYKCRGGGCTGNSTRRLFAADRSSSFRTVPCSSRTCAVGLAQLFSLTTCPSPKAPCTYGYSYADGSNANGLFGTETVTFTRTNGRKTRLRNVLVGCTVSSQGSGFEHSDGIMGLGYNNYSLAIRATKQFGGKFSYCLVDHLSPKNLSSYLIFGSHEQEKAITLNRIRYTELVLGVIRSFYAVNIRGISLGGSMLEIPAEVWNVRGGRGGMILDSGTSLTALDKRAYGPVMDALKLPLKNFRTLKLDIPLSYCFNSTGFNESLFPRLVFHFVDGASFEPLVKSYVIDASEGVKCLGFTPLVGVSVMGNIMQQNHFWEFDLANSRVGFARSSCV